MKVHDYTNRYWGHDYTITEIINKGTMIHMIGWGNGLKKNDYILLQNEGSTTRYKLVSVIYLDNPTDMWKAAAKFAPR